MTIPLFQYDPNGVDALDERVLCDEPVTIGGTTYYRGYLNYLTNDSIGGSTSTTYGSWTAVSKGGTRQTVLLDGYPGSSTSVAVDKERGFVYSTSSRTIYVRYRAHGPIQFNQAYRIEIPYQLEAGASVTIDTAQFPVFTSFAYCTVSINGGIPSATATVSFSNGTEVETVSLTTSTTPTLTTFNNVLKITKGQSLLVSTADGKDAFGISLTLYPLMGN